MALWIFLKNVFVIPRLKTLKQAGFILILSLWMKMKALKWSTMGATSLCAVQTTTSAWQHTQKCARQRLRRQNVMAQVAPVHGSWTAIWPYMNGWKKSWQIGWAWKPPWCSQQGCRWTWGRSAHWSDVVISSSSIRKTTPASWTGHSWAAAKSNVTATMIWITWSGY